jgi:hypothetical protein
MHIHFVNDSRFINRSVERFEHYYPNQNIFIVHVTGNSSANLKHVIPRKEVKALNLSDRINSLIYLNSVCSDGDIIFIHYLSNIKAFYSLALKKKYNIKIYWIFYGADLYGFLNQKNKYRLLDDPEPNSLKDKVRTNIGRLKSSVLFRTNFFNINERFFKQLDYFCFWNHYDYYLLQKWFVTKAKYKYFRYFGLDFNDFNELKNSKVVNNILVNNSASKNGNHITILKKLKKIDTSKLIKNLYLPLSYGNEIVKSKVAEYANKNLSYCSKILLKYIPKKDYNNLLDKIDVSFFGHRRQEAGANIYYLLSSGSKIFLRKDNNLLEYLREMGYVVFEFEKDFTSLNDLECLPVEIKKHNRELVLKEFSQKEIDRTYNELIL